MRINSLSFTEHVNWFWLLAFGRLKATNKNYPQEQRLITYSSTIRKASQSSVCQLKHLRLQHRCDTLLTRWFWLPACEKSLAKLPTWWPAHTRPCEGWSICTGTARRGRCQHHRLELNTSRDTRRKRGRSLLLHPVMPRQVFYPVRVH